MKSGVLFDIYSFRLVGSPNDQGTLDRHTIIQRCASAFRNSGALIAASRVPVPNISIEFTAPAANLLAEGLIEFAVFVPIFKPLF